MRYLTNLEYTAIERDFCEFHEVAELHASGVLIEVEFYDSCLNGESVAFYIVTTKTVNQPTDICHVFDHVEQRHRVPLNADATSHQIIVTYQQSLMRTETVAFETVNEAMEFACSKVKGIAAIRCN
jgi:hypothetical protein